MKLGLPINFLYSFFKGKRNANLRIYLVSMVIASSMWILMKLSDNYTKLIDVPIELVDLPKGYAIINNPDSIVRFNVNTDGVNLWNIILSNNRKVRVSMKRARTLKSNNGYKNLFLSSQELISEISKGLDVKVVGKIISPDSVFVTLDKVVSRTLPVILVSDFDTEKGFRIYKEPKVSPAKVRITGPESELEKLVGIKTKIIKKSKLKEGFESKIDLVLPPKCNSLSNMQADLKVEVVQFIDAEIEVPLNVKTNIPNLMLKTFPNKIKLNYQVAMPDYEKIKDSSFLVYVMVDSLKLLTDAPLIPYLAKKPVYVENVVFGTNKVDYIIIKK